MKLLALLLIFPLLVSCSDHKVHVMDTEGASLENAEVIVVDDQNQGVIWSTNVKGFARVKVGDDFGYLLVRKEGYQPKAIRVEPEALPDSVVLERE